MSRKYAEGYSYQERVIICMVPLEHADAEQLADTLAPFLSPQGKISAYAPTNTLIIKDHPSVVRTGLQLKQFLSSKPGIHPSAY